MHFLVHGQRFVEDIHIAVIGEPQVADAAFAALLHEIFYHAVIDKTAHEGIVGRDGIAVFVASRQTHAVEHVEVEIIDL